MLTSEESNKDDYSSQILKVKPNLESKAKQKRYSSPPGVSYEAFDYSNMQEHHNKKQLTQADY